MSDSSASASSDTGIAWDKKDQKRSAELTAEDWQYELLNYLPHDKALQLVGILQREEAACLELEKSCEGREKELSALRAEAGRLHLELLRLDADCAAGNRPAHAESSTGWSSSSWNGAGYGSPASSSTTAPPDVRQLDAVQQASLDLGDAIALWDSGSQEASKGSQEAPQTETFVERDMISLLRKQGLFERAGDRITAAARISHQERLRAIRERRAAMWRRAVAWQRHNWYWQGWGAAPAQARWQANSWNSQGWGDSWSNDRWKQMDWQSQPWSSDIRWAAPQPMTTARPT
mmetsp:Transcript_88870/g.162957  ORF Transcript_88870/g.162957 Transcript_88870/m.162957 type:complete len:291 (-) Transcript_88870:95-967(-)